MMGEVQFKLSLYVHVFKSFFYTFLCSNPVCINWSTSQEQGQRASTNPYLKIVGLIHKHEIIIK